MAHRKSSGNSSAPIARRGLAVVLALSALMLPLQGSTPPPATDSSDPNVEPPLRTIEVEGIAATLEEMRAFSGPPAAGDFERNPELQSAGTISLTGKSMVFEGYPPGVDVSPVPGVVPPPLLASFPAMPDLGNYPPDTQGAAGPDHLVAILNTGFTVFDKASGATLFGPLPLWAFWSPLGTGPGEPARFPFDPKILFDQSSGRWIVMSDSYFSANSHLLVAISNDANPLLGFTMYAIRADPSDTTLADFPALGVDPGHVYITNNMLSVSNYAFSQSKIWVLDKNSMLAGGPLQVSEFMSLGRTWKPAHAFGPTAVNFMISAGWSIGATTQLLRIKQFEFPQGNPGLRDLGFVQVADFGFVPLQSAPQKGCSAVEIFPGIENAVFRNGKLWAVHDVDGPPDLNLGRSEVAWYEIDPHDARLSTPYLPPLRQGRIRDPELYFYYPSISVNADETLGFGFSGSGPNHFIGAYYAIRQPSDPPDAMPPVGLLKEGESPYAKLGGGRNRWGDYSATVVDPADDRTFWTIQEYAAQEVAPGCPTNFTGRYGTWWGSFRTCATDADCDDGLICNGIESCDAGSGHCLAGDAVTCPDDGDPCTLDVCDEEFNACNAPIPDSEIAAGIDGICLTPDDNPSLYGPDGLCGTPDDLHGDGLCDTVDNCTLVSNPGQEDGDEDGRGDVCDNCASVANADQADGDGDHLGDLCDNCPVDPNPPPPVPIASFDFEAGPAGWTSASLGDGFDTWHVTTLSCRGFDFGTTVYFSNGNDGPSCTPDSAREQSRVLSPPIMLPADGTILLKFDAIDGDQSGRCIASGDVDAKDVGISTDGGLSYALLNDCFALTTFNWIERAFDISSFAGRAVQIVFVYDTIDSIGGQGFGVDNVSILSIGNDQADVDGDGVGDVCDLCPMVFDPDQDDGDGDGVGDRCDNCDSMSNAGQDDADGDGRGDSCDNCSSTVNFGQYDRDFDGSGDACQPFVKINRIIQDGGPTAVAEVLLFDPQLQPLSGDVSLEFGGGSIEIHNLFPDLDCSNALRLGVGTDAYLAYFSRSGRSQLMDAARLGCPATSNIAFAFGRCEDAGLSFANDLATITSLATPFDLCIRLQTDITQTQNVSVLAFDSASATLGTSVMSASPFGNSELPALDLSSMPFGQTGRVAISATDGDTPPVSDATQFVSGGETALVFTLDHSPVADAGPDQALDCSPGAGLEVHLDGSASTDPDSSTAGNDIVLFEWFEDLGYPTERFLGSGESVDALLAPGQHHISLRVTDTAGATAVDEASVSVVENPPPVIGLTAAPAILWPPNHRLVDVSTDLSVDTGCGPAVLQLESITSSEPDDAGSGDGRTVGDIREAEIGDADFDLQLRAERDGSGPGRIYTVVYRATDTAGKSSTASATVLVPHDQGGITEPLMLRVEEQGAGTLISWSQVPGANTYEVVRGHVGSLKETEEFFHLGQLTCISSGSPATSTAGYEDSALPPPGEAFIYFAGLDDGTPWAFGTESVAKERFAPPGQLNCP